MLFLKKYDNSRRMRIEFPGLDEKKLNGLEKLLGQMDGITHCEANYVLNTLTINCDEGISGEVQRYLSELKPSEIPLGVFNPKMIRKDFVQKTAEGMAKRAIVSMIFPRIMRARRGFR